MLLSVELRERFLAFFAARHHARVASDSLIPSGDPTVLFTSAGMNQFKDYFLGKRTDLTRAVSCQKCLRTGDLDAVGDASHHSFFEMLGNFSFGDYFKEETIQWAWEFLTGTLDFAGTQRSTTPDLCLNLPAERLWVSIYGEKFPLHFEEDEEARRLWHDVVDLPQSRIVSFGQADNFWPANAPKEGPNGPCGPCSEIYFSLDGNLNKDTSLEVWNLVFTQFDRQPDGSLKPLPRPNIDTGMGLERLTRVIQGTKTDYETDLFKPIISEIHSRISTSVIDPKTVFAVRTLADHLRAIVFLLTEGLLPSNESRGYVLRMLIRRAHRFARLIGLPTGTGAPYSKSRIAREDLLKSVVVSMKESPYHPDLVRAQQLVFNALAKEEEQFVETLDAGTARLEEIMRKYEESRCVPGDEAFKLYDTYGFPLELTIDIAQEHDFRVDRTGFESALKVQRERSRAASQFSGEVFVTSDTEILPSGVPLKREEAYVGPDSKELVIETEIVGIRGPGVWNEKAVEGDTVGVILKRSPFYGESGGQVGDQGVIETPKGALQVLDTKWDGDLLVHHGKVTQGLVRVNEPVRARVDVERRLKVARSHTAAHMLHSALRKVLGPEAVQAGSFVEAERIRFDFSSLKGMQEEQRHEVEKLVNTRVRLADAVRADQMAIEEAKHAGALALFGEKYDNRVRVITIGDYSKELCGGTHLPHTGFVGQFLIVGESSIAAGTRRIEALVGGAAAEQQHQHVRLLQEAAKRLGRPAHEVVVGLEELLDQLKRTERERKALQEELAKIEAERLVAQAKRINGILFVTSTIKQADRELLATMADAVRRSLDGEGLVLLASSEGPSQVSLVMAATPSLAKRLHAGQLLKSIAPMTKGSGGGRPEFAQAGGKDPSAIPAALKRAEELVREALER